MSIIPIPEPRTLYHYTTQTGIAGIVGSGTAWATSICYMNDAREFNYSRELLQDVLASSTFQKDEPFAGIAPFLKPPSMDVYPHVFVFSLSEKDDRLGLWRAYAGGAAGYSLGFTTADLRTAAEKEGFKLMKCTYNFGEQQKLIVELVNRTREEVNIFPVNTIKMFFNSYIQRFWEEFSLLAAQIKHPSFLEEEEWRIVSNGRAGEVARDGKKLAESKSTFLKNRKILLRSCK